ncbi:O-antigen ligase [Singulisphaera sp. GP187]|uniref:O-antigen ligase family protein n=1 Tax=Singulisphaera sp. GP187 TaxID=1882752 RepID=UPI000928F10E|nr:O-antigen ligase family protein [Singulisphaera sp. GP187]SIO55513.1 O-antigen ligase [Singulisphaera sp. GP187]
MLIRRCQYASEAILIAMACLAPWAFGAVEAWAEFVLFLGIFLLAILSLLIRAGTDRVRALFCLPSVALGGLVLLVALQATSLSPGVLKRISPATVALRAGLTPAEPEQVSGDSGGPIALPASTLSLEPDASRRAAMRLAAGWVLFQAVMGLGLGTASLRRFGIALAVNAALLSLFSLIQLLSWNGRIYWVRETPSGSSGPFVNHNHLAAYLNLGLGFALTFLMAPRSDARSGDRQRGDQVWAGYVTGLIIVGIVASLARSGFVAMLVAIGLVVVLLRPQAKKLVLSLGGIGLLVVVLLIALGSSTGYQERIASILESNAYADRLVIWQTAGRLIPSYAIFGTGLGSFATVTSRFYLMHANVIFEHAENEYIEWLLEGGVLGLGLVLAAVAGTVALGWRALKGASSRAESALICGAFFGISSLIVQSLGDFALHVPAVSVVAVILGAYLAKLGLEARNRLPEDRPISLGRRAGSVLGAVVMLALSTTVLVEGVHLMQVETAMSEAGFYLQGSAKPAAGEADASMDELERKQDALERVIRIRPDWADGHWKLGLVFLRLYSTSAEESLREFEKDQETVANQASPLWLFSTAHSLSGGKPIPIADLLNIDHIRLYLVPAARCFLEARRCSPLLPDPHARLALLDYLLQGGEPPKVSADRAVRLAGPNLQVLELVQGVAIQIGDLDLLARCWKRILGLAPESADAIVEIAKELYPAQQLVDRIIPSGPVALRFAERAYTTPEERPSRELLLRTALKQLAADTSLEPADRFQAEAHAWFLMNDREQAKSLMEQALVFAPKKTVWRAQLIDWLIGWGQARDAYDQAMIGLYYSPGDTALQQAHSRAADAVAKTER